MKTVTFGTENFSKRVWRVSAFTILVLSIPLVAMQFTSEVAWDVFDFIVAGTLLVGTGLIYEYLGHILPDSERRILLRFALLIIFLLVWAELAVGVFGTPFAGS